MKSEVIDLDSRRAGELPDEMTQEQFNRICEELRWQPSFRKEQDKAVDYYDGNQLTPEVVEELRNRGMGPLISNLVKATVDVVLGMEAKTRTDWRVTADVDAYQEVAEALSVKLTEAERESRADRACSDAYSGMIKAGMGWVEISRHYDPFKYPHRVMNIHRREMYWDWTAKDPALDDANYLLRRRWIPQEQAIAFFPEKRSLFLAIGTGWDDHWLDRSSTDISLIKSFEDERGWSFDEYEWRDTVKKRLCFYETFYRQWVRGHVLTMRSDNRAFEFDPHNQLHIVALGSGRATVKPAIYTRLRQALWVGPHKILDQSWQSRHLPYVPFWGYREDLTGIPYGIIRAMISPQDEVNARRQKLMWLLSAKRVTVDSDALDKRFNTLADLMAEVSRADALIVRDPSRRNQDAIQVDHNLGLSEQEFQIMKDAEGAIQRITSVFAPMLGDDKAGAKSGVAINSLIEQGTTVLAEINDNYAYSRRLVGERLLALVKEDMAGQEVMVVIGESGQKKKHILLNKPAIDPDTQIEYLENDVSKSNTKVALSDVPSTPAYRAQMVTMLTEVMKGMPPDLQSVLLPFYLEATDLPKRREMADVIRKQLGLASEDGEEVDPEKAQLQQAVQELQAQLDSPALEESKAKAVSLLADAQVKSATAKKTVAEAEKLRFDMAQPPVDTQQDQQRFLAETDSRERTEVNKAQAASSAQVQSARFNLEAERTKTEGEIQKARLAAEAEVEKARLMANAQVEVGRLAAEATRQREDLERDEAGEDKLQEVVKGFAESLKTLQAELTGSLKEVEQRTAAAVEKATAAQAQPAATTTMAAPPQVSVILEAGAIQVDAKSQSKKIELRRNADGSISGEAKET